jgi:hypothetical protein
VTGPLEKLAAWVLGQIGRHLWGFAPVLMPRIVERMGPVGAVRWMGKNMPEYERILKTMGPIRCHLACMVASLLNGCAYCAYGHARPIQLYYFRDRGALFPLDEHELIALSHVEDQELSSRLEQALEAAGMREEISLIRRLRALKFDGAVPESEEDRRLVHLLHMFEVLNSCGIDRLVPWDDAHDPVYRDKELQARYAQARLDASQTL